MHTDPPIVGANPAVPHFKDRNHNPSVSIQRYCPISPRNIVEVCQPQQPYNIQSSIEVRSAPTTLCTIWIQHRFTLWSHLTGCLNHFESLQKSFSVASQNFSPPPSFCIKSCPSKVRLACWYTSAASEVPQISLSPPDAALNLVQGLPPQQAPTTLRSQLSAAVHQ